MKKEFLQTNDRIVSLKNVSNININARNNRIIFNMNYNIEIEKNQEYKIISDYVYWDLLPSQFDDTLVNLSSHEYITDNFIPHNNGYINKDEISSIKFAEKKQRVIFNLSHTVSFIDNYGNQHMTSEFVYVNFKTDDEYNSYVQEIKSKLGL